MPFRVGEVFLFGFFVLLLYVIFRERPRAKETSRVSRIERDDATVATVVEAQGATPKGDVAPGSQPIKRSAEERTGRKANVAGLGTLFECVEYRCDGGLETRVHRIDGRGRQLSPSCVYREPFESVIKSFTTVAA